MPELDQDSRRAVGIYFRRQPHPSITFEDLRKRVCHATGISVETLPGEAPHLANITIRRESEDEFLYVFDDPVAQRYFRHKYTRVPPSVTVQSTTSLQGLWRGTGKRGGCLRGAGKGLR